jgi:predicted transposase/invertase (TIGR01784 family)
VTEATKTPHDAVFKSVFEKPEHAAAELRHILPAELVAAVEWSSLALESGSFVDPKLSDQHSDLLFSATATHSGERVLVYILFEHQSTSDPKMALRMLSYMVSIWNRYAKNNPDDPLPLIIPALLAQVPGGWSAPTRFSELFTQGARDLGRSVLPDFVFAIDDLDHASNEELAQRALADQVKLTLWLMRDVRDQVRWLGNVARWVEVLERLARSPDGEDALALLLRYAALVSGDLQLAAFRGMLKGTAPTVESLAMTIAEQLEAKVRAEGRVEGRMEGRVEGRAEGTAASILMVLAARGLPVSDAARSRIEACTDLETLDQWLVAAATTTATDDIFRA